MEGWISTYRKILENPIVCKDSDYFAVWMYLLLNATHKESPAIFNKKKIILKKGQLITGRKAIAEKFDISESKVQRILKTFEIEQQIEQQVNNKRTTTEQQVNTNKNVKNIYLFLFNKYKEQIEKDFTKKTRIISKCKECSDYALLTQEEQDDLFYDLMSVDMDKKFR